MIQGSICLHTFKQPDKRRPVLILTRDSAIPELTWITIAPLTTTMRDISSEVWLDESDGVAQPCAVSLDNIQTVQKDKISKPIAQLSQQRMIEVFKAIKFAFGFDK